MFAQLSSARMKWLAILLALAFPTAVAQPAARGPSAYEAAVQIGRAHV